MGSLYEYRFYLENELLGDGDEIGNLFEHFEEYCESTRGAIPDKFEDVEEIIKSEPFFQYILSEITSGEIITLNSMEIFPELCGEELTQNKNEELYDLFCVVMRNYFQNQYNSEWEFIDLEKYDRDSEDRIFIGESKLHIDGKIELIIYSEPKNMKYDEENHTIQILGKGHHEAKASSVFCNIQLEFSRIKLFWNAEYDYYSGEKLVGTEIDFSA